jgi:hypothetical protein
LAAKAVAKQDVSASTATNRIVTRARRPAGCDSNIVIVSDKALQSATCAAATAIAEDNVRT